MIAWRAIFLFLLTFPAWCAADEGMFWSVAGTNDLTQVVVRNANRMRAAEGVLCKWTVLRNGEPYAAGSFDLKGLSPGSSHVYAMPEAFGHIRRRSETAALRVRFMETPEKELARSQIDAPDETFAAYRPHEGVTLTRKETAETLTFESGDLSLSFSKRTGLLSTFRRKGFFSDDLLLAAPMKVVAPSLQASEFACTVEDFSSVDAQPIASHFTVHAQARAAETVAFVRFDWTVYRDGVVRCFARLRPAVGQTLPADVGLRFAFASDEAEIDYFAKDDLLGRYSAEAVTLAARTKPVRGTRALEAKDGSRLLGFAAALHPFSFAVDATGDATGLSIFPEGALDVRRPRELHFIIGPRRFANVVGAN